MADAIEALNAQLTELYERRAGIWLVTRAMDPPVTQARLAAASRVTEARVIQTLRSRRERDEAG